MSYFYYEHKNGLRNEYLHSFSISPPFPSLPLSLSLAHVRVFVSNGPIKRQTLRRIDFKTFQERITNDREAKREDTAKDNASYSHPHLLLHLTLKSDLSFTRYRDDFMLYQRVKFTRCVSC